MFKILSYIGAFVIALSYMFDRLVIGEMLSYWFKIIEQSTKRKK